MSLCIEQPRIRCIPAPCTVEAPLETQVHGYFHAIKAGLLAGAADFFCLTPIAAQLLSQGGIEVVQELNEEGPYLARLFDEVVWVPFLEEFICRVLILGACKWVAVKIVPDHPVEILGVVKLPLSTLVAIVASGIIFGALHFPDGGLGLMLVCSMSGILYGIVKEQVGLLGSYVAHGLNNGLCHAADALLAMQ